MIRKNKAFLVGILAMAIVVTASNILVAFPIGNWLTWGAFIYPLAFFITDVNNKIFGTKLARKVVLFGFVLGVILSLVFADFRIAVASGTAFLVAQFLDIFIFSRIRNTQWWKAPLLSSLVASAVDTELFFFLAFFGTLVPWISLGVGDYFAKLFMAFLLLIPFRILLKKIKNKKDILK